MTLLSTLGFQPRKRKELIAPTSIGFSDITVILPVKTNQKGVTLFLTEFLRTHPPASYPREIIIVDNNSQPPISIPGSVYVGSSILLSYSVLLLALPAPEISAYSAPRQSGCCLRIVTVFPRLPFCSGI